MLIARLKHHAKVVVGHQLTKVLAKQYDRGKGPVARLVHAFSRDAEEAGIDAQVILAPVEIPMAPPKFFLNGKQEAEYLEHLRSGVTKTSTAGIISADDVDVSFPTGMHQVGRRIMQEAMLAPYLLTNPKYFYGLESLRFKRKQRMSEGILLSTPWHHNFFHWMIEILPRLCLCERSPHTQHLPLIVPKSSRKFVYDSLALTGYLPRATFLPDGAYRFDKLHMLSQLGSPTGRVSPDAIEWLNKTIERKPSTIDLPRRLYVSRSDANIRFVSNESELDPVLAEYGFTKMKMSSLRLADQIEVFRSAECIAGPHGAAFVHLAFAQPGGTFIEFFSYGHHSTDFNRICGIRGLRYGFLVGKPTAIGGFSIDPPALRSVLDQAIGRQ